MGLLASALWLGGCGTVVPEIRDFGGRSDADTNELVIAIVKSVRCEVKDAVIGVINADKANAALNGFRSAKFFEQWGAQIALTLQIDERTALNPNAAFTPVSSIFSLAGGLSGSVAATRIDKLNYFYSVRELYGDGRQPCAPDSAPPRGSLLIQSDLKLREWLSAMITGVATRNIVAIGAQNVISHQVTFQIVTTGTVTPTWKLVNATVNPGGPFLSTSRDRKHDLLVTFGPINKEAVASLVPIAESSHLSSQLASEINSRLRF